jgi:hypothetical protein
MIAGFNGHARIEGRFYSEVRPLLEIEAPICYYSTFDRETFAAIHLLEDLVATKSATFCGHKTYVSCAMAEDMIDLLAALHGRFYGKLAGKGQFRWLADYPTWFGIGAQKMRTEHYTCKAFDAGARVIPPRLMARRNEIWPATMRALAVHEHEPTVFLHSDVHIGNWYQTGAGRMGLCDWQCPRVGIGRATSPMRSAPPSCPRTAEAGNVTCSSATSIAWPRPAGARLDFDRSFKQYRQQLSHALAMWTITLCHSPLLPSMQSEAMTLALIERIAIAIDDLDALDSI